MIPANARTESGWLAASFRSLWRRIIREPTRRTARVRRVGRRCASTLGATRIGWFLMRLTHFSSAICSTTRWSFTARPARANPSLALGLAQRWRQLYPQDQVIVTCGPDFARSYANAVDTDSLATFRRKSRSADLFVLDDVHLHAAEAGGPKRIGTRLGRVTAACGSHTDHTLRSHRRLTAAWIPPCAAACSAGWQFHCWSRVRRPASCFCDAWPRCTRWTFPTPPSSCSAGCVAGNPTTR